MYYSDAFFFFFFSCFNADITFSRCFLLDIACSTFLGLLSVIASLDNYMMIICMLLFLTLLPEVSALPEQDFPDITFKVFNDFVKDNFSSKVTLSTVLLVLFSLTDNPELLSLHAKQQNPTGKGENAVRVSAWMKALVRALIERLGEKSDTLLKKTESHTGDQKIVAIGDKLDHFSKLLDLYPYDDEGNFQGKLKPTSHDEFKPVLLICPNSPFCMTKSCKRRSLMQHSSSRDKPTVTLIKGNEIHEKAYVLTGICTSCKTLYWADRERTSDDNNIVSRVYLNSARYLKIGHNTWVDRVFSAAVLNGMYSFHASAAAYTEFWNNSYSENSTGKMTRRLIWQAFVQESIRSLGAASELDLVLPDGLPIDDVTKSAFEILGDNGYIWAAHTHECSECTQPYKGVADSLLTGEDPAALVGEDENRPVPSLVGEGADLAAADASQARSNAQQQNQAALDVDIDENAAPVKMIVMDGIVMGPTHCAYDNCTSELANARGGAFCHFHDLQHGAKCRVRGCTSTKKSGTQACSEHQGEWKKHSHSRSKQSLAGVKRMLQRPAENMPWQPSTERPVQPHDQPTSEPQLKHYFSPSRFYCVETITAPCGVVIAWTKFDKAESPTNILNWLETIFPTEESRPDYICIDKACLVLRTAIANGSWERIWKKTTRFIVDSYHYINHCTTDYICRKWCNPAPLNSSAPNLVISAVDKNGQPYLKRAFNTQV